MDTFSAQNLDTNMWMIVGPNGATTVTQGQLTVIPPVQSMGNFGITRRSGLALVGGSVEVEVVQVAMSATQYTYFIVGITTGNTAGIAATNNELQAVTVVNGSMMVDSFPWDVRHRYWRISFDDAGTTVRYATRPDPNSSWSEFATQTTTAPTIAGVGFGVGEGNTSSSSGQARFDNFVAYCGS